MRKSKKLVRVLINNLKNLQNSKKTNFVLKKINLLKKKEKNLLKLMEVKYWYMFKDTILHMMKYVSK